MSYYSSGYWDGYQGYSCIPPAGVEWYEVYHYEDGYRAGQWCREEEERLNREMQANEERMGSAYQTPISYTPEQLEAIRQSNMATSRSTRIIGHRLITLASFGAGWIFADAFMSVLPFVKIGLTVLLFYAMYKLAVVAFAWGVGRFHGINPLTKKYKADYKVFHFYGLDWKFYFVIALVASMGMGRGVPWEYKLPNTDPALSVVKAADSVWLPTITPEEVAPPVYHGHQPTAKEMFTQFIERNILEKTVMH